VFEVMTGEHVLKSHGRHAHSHIAKPIDLGQFMRAIKSLEDFGLTIVNSPRNGNP
jgi:hypothetical protein